MFTKNILALKKFNWIKLFCLLITLERRCSGAKIDNLIVILLLKALMKDQTIQLYATFLKYENKVEHIQIYHKVFIL